MRDNDSLFREMPVRRAVLSLAIPTVISQIITVIYNMADTFFIGQLNDPNQVAAATVAMPAFAALTALSNLFGIGGASKIARCLGKQDEETAKRTAAFSIWTAIAVALFCGIIVFLTRSRLLPILGANAVTYDFCSDYTELFLGIRGVAWATPLDDWFALIVSLLLFVPYINRIKAAALPSQPFSRRE